MLGVMFGAGGYTFYYADDASYLSNNPANCHVPHDLVGKNLTKMENGYLHSKAFTLENFS